MPYPIGQLPAWQYTSNRHGEETGHLQSELPVWADLPKSACMEQLDSGLRQVAARPRCEGMGRSGLFTTRRPGCTPCSHSKD